MKRTVLLLPMLMLGIGCTDHPAAAPVEAGPPVAVPTVRLGDSAGLETYRAAGTVRAARRAELATRMMARIETIRVRAGDRVRSGQMLATLERGAVSAAGSQAAAGLELATANLRRMERLYADSAVPLAQLEAARATFAQARGQTDAATAELGYASIVAPFDGVIAARFADPGDLAAPGQPLLVVEDAGAREIVAGVPEAVARGLGSGSTLTALIGPEREPVTATVAAVVASADPLSRTVEVRLSARGPLVPGQVAIVEVPMAGRRAAQPSIPRSAVVARGELTGVYLVGADSTARLRWIRLGRADGDDVIVTSGLVAGDVVVTEPARVRDGVRVYPTGAESGGAS